MYANLCKADALHVQIVQRRKDIANPWFTRSTKQTRFKTLNYAISFFGQLFHLWSEKKIQSRTDQKRAILNLCGCKNQFYL